MWKAQISIYNNIIEAWVECENQEEQEYCYYLYNIENVLIEKSKWTKEKKYSFTVEKEGIYYARIYKKENNIKTSKPTPYVDYYSQNTRLEFEEFCNQKKEYQLINTIMPDFFYKMNYPYKDFAIVVDEPTITEGFLKRYGFAKKESIMGTHHIQILAECDEFMTSKNYIFSGLAKHKSSLIYGEKDITAFVKISDSNIGNFTYTKLGRSKIQIGNDYFGTGKIYYYKDNNHYIISNNYHLILLIIKDLKIEVQVNNKLILALLCKSRQAFQQSICREREICNAFMLPIDEYIEISKNGVCFQKKSISAILKMDKKQSIKNLDRLLEKGKKEILDNTGIILADKRCNRVLVDLTGGLDSRLVYGTIQYFEKYCHKAVIISDGQDAYVNRAIHDDNSDISIAIRLDSSLNKYGYDDAGVDLVWLDVNEAENQMMSQSVLSGYYYPHSTLKMITKACDKEPSFRLNGFYGEICCRPYFTRKMLEQGKNYEDMDAFFPAVANRSGVLSGSAYNALKDKLEEELEILPGSNLVEKWETHYLFYRNGLHCNTIWEFEKRTPAWGPLQSKTLFKYKHLTFGNISGIEEQLKLLYKMDNRLIKVPFTDGKDEQERVDFLKHIEGGVCSEILGKKSFEDEKDKWWKCREKRRKNSIDHGHNGVAHQALKARGEKYDQEFGMRMEELLHKLMNYNNGEFREVFGIPIYCALKQNSLSLNEMKMLYQKLLSVYVQIWLLKSTW